MVSLVNKVLIASTAALSSWAFGANVNFVLEPATNGPDKEVLATIEQSNVLQQVDSILQEHFHFSEPVEIVFGDHDGPLFDPNENSVFMPYSFVNASKQYFDRNNHEKEYGIPSMDAALHTLAHTLFHEIAHAYIMDQGIPILGKEEDAADNLATLMLLEHYENGDTVAISAADMFAYESEDGPEYYENLDYIGEHSFDLQRYFSTLCLVYGSAPENHSSLLDEIDEESLEDRKEYCEEYYETVKGSWQVYLN